MHLLKNNNKLFDLNIKSTNTKNTKKFVLLFSAMFKVEERTIRLKKKYSFLDLTLTWNCCIYKIENKIVGWLKLGFFKKEQNST